MNITFLGQGYEAASKSSVGNYLIKFFADKDFHTFTGLTAFTSQAGVRGLSKHISIAKKHLKMITIVTGVDQKGTSKEALEALIELKVKVFVFYQPAYTIFHPKVYLFEGTNKSELIIGSSNLTSQGLFTNVESSLLISIDNSIDEDRVVVEKLKEYFKGVFDLTDPNLQKLSKKIIKDLVKAKIVPTEEERKAVQDKAEKTERKKTDKIISKIFPKRDIAKLPKEFTGTSTPKRKAVSPADVTLSEATPRGKLVWTRRKLPASSVQVSGTGTNPTGGLRLVQDEFEIKGEKIAHTTYFRNDIFGQYNWKQIKKSPFVEATTIPFEVTIFKEFKGIYDLEVRHKPSGEAGQGNYTTSISWGDLGEVIKEANLTGARLDIYASKRKKRPFHIVIK